MLGTLRSRFLSDRPDGPRAAPPVSGRRRRRHATATAQLEAGTRREQSESLGPPVSTGSAETADHAETPALAARGPDGICRGRRRYAPARSRVPAFRPSSTPRPVAGAAAGDAAGRRAADAQ